MILRWIAVLAAVMSTNTALAGSFDLNVGSDSVRATYAAYVGKKSVTDVGILVIDAPGNSNENETVLHAGLNFVFDHLRFGGRLLYATPGVSDVMALGFGAQARFGLSQHVGLGGHFYIAPESTSFMDAKGYNEFAVRLDYKVATGAYVYVGYRNLKVKVFTVNNRVELDDDLHLGLKLHF